MTNINVTSLRKNLFNVLDNTIKFNEAVNVSTKEGNAIIISEEEYNGLLATLELCSNVELKDKIIKGAKTPIEECVNVDEVDW